MPAIDVKFGISRHAGALIDSVESRVGSPADCEEIAFAPAAQETVRTGIGVGE